MTPLEMLADASVFNCEFVEGKTKLIFKEACDGYYWISLNKDELLKLILELQSLASQMK